MAPIVELASSVVVASFHAVQSPSGVDMYVKVSRVEGDETGPVESVLRVAFRRRRVDRCQLNPSRRNPGVGFPRIENHGCYTGRMVKAAVCSLCHEGHQRTADANSGRTRVSITVEDARSGKWGEALPFEHGEGQPDHPFMAGCVGRGNAPRFFPEKQSATSGGPCRPGRHFRPSLDLLGAVQ